MKQLCMRLPFFTIRHTPCRRKKNIRIKNKLVHCSLANMRIMLRYGKWDHVSVLYIQYAICIVYTLQCTCEIDEIDQGFYPNNWKWNLHLFVEKNWNCFLVETFTWTSTRQFTVTRSSTHAPIRKHTHTLTHIDSRDE